MVDTKSLQKYIKLAQAIQKVIPFFLMYSIYVALLQTVVDGPGFADVNY